MNFFIGFMSVSSINTLLLSLSILLVYLVVYEMKFALYVLAPYVAYKVFC